MINLEEALKQIGVIDPWFVEDVNAYVFEHELFPAVRAAGDSREDVIEIYPLYLQDYLEEESRGNVSPLANITYKGRK